ncbi:MAG: hypothetical protein K8R21_05940 [Leptospira sp.]|nr:hypothetical protein [Leptospira sp.]
MAQLTRTDAHKVFANLYRKQRTPEHQAKIDDILTRSNDVFIRIDMIKKADEDFYTAKNAEATSERNNRERKPEPKPSGNQKQNSRTQKAAPPQGGGFLSAIFGGSNNISKFAKESGALELGLFGRNPVISKNVEKIFRGLKEDQIIATIQALKLAEQQGWRHWSPLVYNVVNNYNKFFNNFIGLDSLFIDNISPETFINRSTKMQMYYVRIIKRPDSAEIILTNVLELVQLDEKLKQKSDIITAGLEYGLNLEKGRPTLTDALCAFHIAMTKKMIEWEDLEKLLNVAPIDEYKYKSSPEVAREVETTIAKLGDDIKTRLEKKDELTNLRNRFFKIDDSGKISFDFLGQIIDDYISKHFPESMQTPALKSSFKSIPHKLLYLLVRDFQSVYFSLLEGYIKIGDKNQSKDVLIIQSGLFLPELEKINQIVRNLDAFSKKYPSFQYTFQAMSENISKGVEDQIESQLLKMLAEAGEAFGKFAAKISIIIGNHLMAKEYEASGQLNERVLTTKEKSIEEVKILHRFIPYADSRIVLQNRLNGRTIEETFFEMTKLLYNYAIIYKDATTTSKLTMHKRIDADLEKLYSEYERLSGTPFNSEKNN